MDVASETMAELARGMFLVGTFVAGKAHVAIDAKHRPAVRARVSNELLADLRQMRRQRHDEIRHWRLHIFPEARFIRLEPLAPIVCLQLAEEREEVLRKTM